LRKRPKPSPFEEAARKDSAVHVSLSSDSLFKQPGTSQLRRPDIFGVSRRTSAEAEKLQPRPKNIKPVTSDAANEHGHKEHGRMLGHRVKQ
jgi:hypothetical protein